MTILINNKNLKKSSKFPGGEVHIQLPEFDLIDDTILVDAKLRSSDDIMQLILVKEALDYYYPNTIINLKCLYIPYARQDRRCREGEAFSSYSFTRILDSLNFRKIIFADIHSHVVPTLLNTTHRNIGLIDIFATRAQPIIESAVLVSPDKGAFKKVSELSEFLVTPLVSALKTRGNNGEIFEMKLSEGTENIDGRNLLIVDDICDGGATFINLAKLLLEYNPKSISLYVTHGIFSKGLDCLFNAGISQIFTTDSFCQLEPVENKLTIWKL